MTKTELMETYTAEQIADMVVKLNNAMDSLKYSDSFLKSGLFDNPEVAACETRINILQNKINNLEEENGRLQSELDTYNNYLLPRCTKEAKEMIDHNHFSGVTVVSLEQLDNRIKKESNEPDIRGYEETINGLQSEVEKYRKSFEDAKKEHDCQVAEYKNRAEKDKTELERAKNTINQIDYILEKLFDVRHDAVDKPDEFEKILSERLKGNVTDFLPTEPIKAADMLINAEGEYEHNPVVKKICGTDKGTYRIFDVGELRQIAEHLLVYCNHNEEVEE